MSEDPTEFDDQHMSDDAQTATEEQRATSIRHSLMLRAMSHARKSFNEVSSAELPEGFSIDSDIGDLDGWPMLRLELFSDPEIPRELPHLEITTSDADSKGLVQFALSTGEILGRLNLRCEKDFTKITPFVKRSVREFLDLCQKTCEEIGPLPNKKKQDNSKNDKETDILLMEADIFSDSNKDSSENKLHEEDVEPLEPIELF